MDIKNSGAMTCADRLTNLVMECMTNPDEWKSVHTALRAAYVEGQADLLAEQNARLKEKLNEYPHG